MSSNVAQNYAYTTETEAQRSVALEKALEQFDGLRDKIAAESIPLDQPWTEHQIGDPELMRWWVWICPTDDFQGRLHVAGYAGENRAVYTVCDSCGKTFLR
ncbi:MAG: hypothetical protein H0V12_07420 [Chloroflexi bacterium]|nr:hypothetical protein [Chloroflexota bacterium]